MKGISTILATVLVIALTIAVAGIVALFVNRLATTQTGEVEKGSTGIAECANSFVDILNFNASGHTLLVHNPSSNTIYTTAIYDNMGTVNTSIQQKIGTGNITQLSAGNLPASAATKVTVTGVCENIAGTSNTSITGACPKGASCWTN